MSFNSAFTGEPRETDFLVFRMTPYGENGYIVAGLSPDQGRLSFMVHGNRNPRRSDNPFGLFRRLHVRYRQGNRDIQSYDEAEILHDHSRVSQDYPRYVSACWLGRLCIQNVVPGISAPCFFQSLDVALGRLAEGEGVTEAIETGVLLVYLEENGWLPSWNAESREETQCRILLKMGMGGSMPQLQEENWRQLRAWALGILAQTDCLIPALPERGKAHGNEN